MAEAWAIALVVLGTLIGAGGSFLLKKGADSMEWNVSALMKNTRLFFGLLLFVLASIVFIFALKGGEVSVLYPITALTYIWVALLSVKYLKEKMNAWKIAGTALIIMGVIVLGVL